MAPIARQIVIEKSAVITFEKEVNEMAFRRYLKDHWEKLTLGLNDATILFLAGVHGSDSGELGHNENIQTLKNQVRILNDYIHKSEHIFLIIFFDCSSSRKFFRLIGF